jgi:carboxyl-terminal processing protease
LQSNKVFFEKKKQNYAFFALLAPKSDILNMHSKVRLPLLLAATLAAGMFIGQQLPHYDRHFSLTPRTAVKGGPVEEIIRFVEARYVDSVNTENLRSSAIDHLLSLLDPHSNYISPEELKIVEEDMNGAFEGVGIEFIMLDDTLQVVAAISGGPAETAGILPADRIVSINDTVIAGVKIPNAQLYEKLRGPKGSKVKIGVKRGRETALRFFEVTRDLIPVKSVETAFMLDDQTGYFKIAHFNSTTYQEFMRHLNEMAEKRGLRNLLLDLRGNPGGYLEEATDLLSQIFPEGKLLVYTKGRDGQRKDYKSRGRARFSINQVAVLIDEGSASASEIVAGAVQDWDRGWVVGRRSFGKGLVQEQYSLSNKGAVRLTVARYYTPSGRCIQREYARKEDYEHETERRRDNGELADGAKIRQADSTQFYTGQGRIVYGGGGITPDVFVPIDTAHFSPYFNELRLLIPPFVSRWAEAAPKQTLPKTFPEFEQNFKISDDMLQELASFQTQKQASGNAQNLATVREELKLLLKARIAKVLFGDEAMYRTLYAEDPAVKKAAQLLKSGQGPKKNK